jgi:saccharopine dehydrogenase (NADP+, L-glutamate forming)
MTAATPGTGRPPAVPASGTVHWVGAGLSNGRSGLGELADTAQRLVIWGRDPSRVADRIEDLGLTYRAGAGLLEGDALASQVGPGDVVVSMLPGSEHARLLSVARGAGAHFACASYASDAILAAAEGAAGDGLVVLTESGLDPGIDHLMAHHLVALARDQVGDRAADVRFTSYCGGLPAAV